MNFILRRITKDGHVNNKIIGDNYHLIFNRKPDKEGYAVLAEGYDKDTHAEIHAFIVWNDGRDWTPLYKKSTYYFMTENGKTFDVIKFYISLESFFKAKSLSQMKEEFIAIYTENEIISAHIRGDYDMKDENINQNLKNR
jgi:hypothetical protein